jgi:hypothetical protein
MAAPLDGFPLLPALCRERYDVSWEMGKPMTLSGKLPPWAVLAAVGLVGLAGC